jgi:hypothetical protein
VTGAVEPGPKSIVLIEPFPQPGRLVQLAYRELDLAASRRQDHLLPLRDLANVPRTVGPRELPDAAATEGGFGPGWKLSSAG